MVLIGCITCRLETGLSWILKFNIHVASAHLDHLGTKNWNKHWQNKTKVNDEAWSLKQADLILHLVQFSEFRHDENWNLVQVILI